MAFDLARWKDEFRKRLPGWKTRMQQAGVDSIYAFISAAALWPIVEAARGGNWAALSALGGVLSGLGGNLLANRIQAWKDEADAAGRIAEDAPREEALRAELDAVLEALEAVPLAQGTTSEADRDWFANTLRAELAQLGNLVRYETVLISGGVNIGGGVSVGGDIVGRDKVVYFYQVYLTAPGKARLSESEFGRILSEYLGWVQRACNRARLYGLESSPTVRGRPVRSLAEVFVPITLRRFQPPRRDEVEQLAQQSAGDMTQAKAYLRLVESRHAEGDEVPSHALLTLGDQLAIVGGAGSGKSTVLSYLAGGLATAAQMDTAPPFELPDGVTSLVPLLVPLRYFREYLNLSRHAPQDRLRTPRVGTLAGFVPWYLKQQNPVLETSEDFFDRLLLGSGCLLMLDGLDEVVSREDRGRVREQVENMVNAIYPGNRVIVTARESGYREEAVFGDDFVRLDVQRLDDAQIRALVGNWCRQLYPGEVEKRTGEIMDDIQDINDLRADRDLPPLISTPLLTTMVVSVKWGETELPRERAKLYEACVKVILQAQYVPDDPARKELVEWGGAWDDQRDWLSALALAMQQGGRAGAAVPEARVREVLKPVLAEDNLEKFVEAVRSRGGLFEERAELFQFVHLTFQEFLAARLLAKRRHTALTDLVARVPDSWWREVLLLAYGYAQADYPPFARDYLDWLSTLSGDGEARLAGRELAGAAVLELERPQPDLRRQQAERLRLMLADRTLTAPGVVRARAGDTLARLGDPRFREDAWFLPDEPLLGFVEIPEGAFLMGSHPKRDKDAIKDEQPQHNVHLRTYYIARYPVTVAQFRAFVEGSGYKPRDEDSLRGLPTHPVVRVTWHDALKYCEWLTGKLKGVASQRVGESADHRTFWEGLLHGRLRVTLPSEAEWEKAARGTDGRIYPWGDEFDSNKANTGETGIGTISAVGCFPDGASRYGALDMSGNVWEWTRSLWGKDLGKPEFGYPYDPKDIRREDLNASHDVLRVLRGGSFYYSPWRARWAFRGRDNPDDGGANVGVRVVASPF